MAWWLRQRDGGRRVFGDLATYKARIDLRLREIRSIHAPGVGWIFLPGESERKRVARERRLGEAVPLGVAPVTGLTELGRARDVPFPSGHPAPGRAELTAPWPAPM